MICIIKTLDFPLEDIQLVISKCKGMFIQLFYVITPKFLNSKKTETKNLHLKLTSPIVTPSLKVIYDSIITIILLFLVANMYFSYEQLGGLIRLILKEMTNFHQFNCFTSSKL